MKSQTINFTGSLIAIAALVLTATSHGATLVSYAFPSGSASPTVSGAGVTTNNFASSIADGDQGFSGGGNVFIRTTPTSATQAGALDLGRYFSFTLAATNVGEALDLDQLSLTLFLQTDNADSTTNNLYLQSTVGGFGSSNPVIAGLNTSLTRTSAGSSTTTSTFDLTGASFQGLTGNVEFRLYISDDRNENGKLSRLDDVTTIGDVVAVPEPSSALLLMAGLGTLAWLRRRN